MKKLKLKSTCLVLLAFQSLAISSSLAVETEFETDKSLPQVQLAIVSMTGASTDPSGKSGLSNFAGEMLLRGTQSKSREALEKALDQIGATVQVETRTEALIIRGKVLSRNLPEFLDLLKEVLTQPKFDDSEIGKLKTEITSAILEEMGRDASVSARKFSEFLFGHHPYGQPILGRAKDVESFGREMIVEQHRKLLAASKLLILGQGDSSLGVITAWTKQLVATLPTGPASPVVALKTPDDGLSRRLFIVDKPDRTQTQVEIGQIGVTLKDPDFFPLYVANHAFGGASFQARLMKEIRVQRGWSYGASSRFRHGVLPRQWAVHLFPASKDAAAALEHTLGMVTKLSAEGLGKDEFEFAKRSLVNSSGFMYNTAAKRLENRILELTLQLPEGFMKGYAKRVEAVTLEQSNAALRKFLRPDRLTISVLATAKDLKPALQKAASVAEDQTRVVPFTE